MKILDSEKRQINGEEHEIITLAYAYCGYLGKDTYKIELVKG